MSSSYASTQVEAARFEGSFTPAVDVKLAVLSDDGCTVSATEVDEDGTWKEVIDDVNENVAQALPDAASLRKIGGFTRPDNAGGNITSDGILRAGKTYDISVHYTNVKYTGQADIDGVTLFAYSASERPDQVYIVSSNIDASYYKSDTAGPPIGNPNANPYRILNQRASSGAMTGDRDVHWPTLAPDRPWWEGRGVFEARTTYFTHPVYKWSVSGAGQADPAMYLGNYDLRSSLNISFDDIDRNPPVDVTASTVMQRLNKSSTVTVEVKSGNGEPAGTLSNTYKVDWHLPRENWTRVGDWQTLPPIEVAYGPRGKNQDGQIDARPGDTVSYVKPHPSVEVHADGLRLVALVAEVAGTLAEGYFHQNPAAVGVIAAGKWTVGELAQSGPSPVPLNLPLTYGEWKGAVRAEIARQNQINGTDPALQQAALWQPAYFSPATLLDEALTEIERVERDFPASPTDPVALRNQGQQDVHFSQQADWTAYAIVRAKARKEQLVMEADKFDIHGYANQIQETLITTQSFSAEVTWNLYDDGTEQVTVEG